MMKHLPGPVRGCLSLALYFINTIFWCILLFVMTFFKLVIPVKPWRALCSNILTRIANNWIGVNNFNQRLFSRTNMDVQGVEALDARDWYLVIANHQSWVDILVLQYIFYGKIPFLKFFLKKELIWFPFLGQAWWALDFPFMKRYSKGFLKKNPHLRGKDIEITRKACEKYKNTPVSIMNFVEGTRFRREKHKKQRSPYSNLLKTKAGGMAFVLGAMRDHLHHILDVTIVYPDGTKNFWSYVCGNIKEIKVRVNTLPISEELLGDYTRDREFRKDFHQWLNSLWMEKDKRIDGLLLQRKG